MTTRQNEAAREVSRTANLMLGMAGEAIGYSAIEGLWDHLEDLLEIRKMLIGMTNRSPGEGEPPPKPELPPNRIISEGSAKPDGEIGSMRDECVVPGGVGYEAPISGIAQMIHERNKPPRPRLPPCRIIREDRAKPEGET